MAEPDQTAIPAEARDLFRVPPDRFVGARDALVAELREAGRDDDAAAIKRLRKPTVVTWALNGLAAAAGEAVEALLAAGAELRAAQQAAMSSERHAERLRDATVARRTAVADLRRAARGIVAEGGRAPSATQLDQIGQALEAAAIDPQAAERLRTGTFERPPESPAGFGDVFGLTSVPTAPPKRRAAADRASRQLEELRERLEKHRAKSDDLRAAADAADLQHRRAQKALERADDPSV